MKSKNSFKTAVLVLLIIETAVLAGIVVYLAVEKNSAQSETALDYNYSENGKYVLYIGLNDKDTYTQLIPTDEAIDIVNEICIRHIGGYTVFSTKGGWVDETGTPSRETTLVYSLSGAKEADVIAVMDEVLVALNQNSILIERQNISSTFYSGK